MRLSRVWLCLLCAFEQNLFADISSSAIVLGGVSTTEARPPVPAMATSDNVIRGNLIHDVAREYVDAAGIFVGWGLLDAGMFPGNPGSVRGEWGTFTTPTANSGNKILNNRFFSFGNVLQ